MNDELRKQIYTELNLRETEDLLDIWRTNDRVKWSDSAFEVIKDILQKRISEIPPQNEPILEHEEDIEGLEEWEVKLLDDDNQPELYDPLTVLRLKDNINKVAIAVIVVYVLLGLLNFQFVRMLFQGVLLPTSEIAKSVPDMFFTMLSVGIQIVLLYFPLKALAQILRILMEMELNSRATKN